MTNFEFPDDERCVEKNRMPGIFGIRRLFRLLKTGKLTGEAAGQGEWQLTGFWEKRAETRERR